MLTEKMNAIFPLYHSIFFQPFPVFSSNVHITTELNGTIMILFRTLLNRNLWMNPLSKVMGGWGLWETVNGEQKLTTECIENVIMMVPFSSVVMWTFEEKTGNGW